MAVSAVVFDVDGTLVDSVDLHARAWQEALAHFGVQVSFEEVRQQIGKGSDQLLPMFLSSERYEREGEAVSAWRREHYKRHYLPQVRPFAQVRALFERLRREGLRTAVASSAHDDELSTYLTLTDITDLVDVRTTADDAERSKPHPDIFAIAVERLAGVSPSATIVVGDTPYDAEAASKAGLRTIGVRCGGFDEDWLRRAGCIAIYDDPADLLARIESSPLLESRARRAG